MIAARYGFAVFAVVAASVLRSVLTPALGGGVPFILYFLTVVLCAWYGGLGPGLLSAALGGLIGDTPAIFDLRAQAGFNDRAAADGVGQGAGEAGKRLRRALQPIPVAQLEAIASESSEREREADQAERELFEWKKMLLMEQHLGETFDGLRISSCN